MRRRVARVQSCKRDLLPVVGVSDAALGDHSSKSRSASVRGVLFRRLAVSPEAKLGFLGHEPGRAAPRRPFVAGAPDGLGGVARNSDSATIAREKKG